MTTTARPKLSVERRLELPAAAEKVWDLIGDFGALAAWMPGVSSVIVEGDGVGAVRTCETSQGPFQERLTSMAPSTCGYEMLAGRLPVAGYQAILCVRPSSATSCLVCWSSDFDAAPGVADEIASGAVAAVYAAGMSRLKKIFDGVDRGARKEERNGHGSQGSSGGHA